MAGNISNAVKCLLRSKSIIFYPELLYIANRNQTFFFSSRTLNPLFPQPFLPYQTGVVNFHHSSLQNVITMQKFKFLLNNQQCCLYANDSTKSSSHDSSRGPAPTNVAGDSTTSAAPVELSRKDKLKRAVKEYGATVIVFHVAISLLSLGGFYMIVSSGVDVQELIDQVGLNINSSVTTGASTASTFVMAYAVHKVFAPVRISITLASTPFIVRYLRRIGFLKPPKPSSPATPS